MDKISYINDEFFGRLEALSFNLKSYLAGYFGGKHLVRSYGQTVEFADFREYQLGDDILYMHWLKKKVGIVCYFFNNLYIIDTTRS